jgi:hypothetical protein
MDVSAHGVGALGSIAIGCRGSNPDRSCQFDELMKHILLKPKKIKSWPSTDIGAAFFPDPVYAAQELHEKGYGSDYNNRNMFPDVFPEGGQRTLSDIFKAVTDRIQVARQTMGDDHFVRELRSARSAITYTIDARLHDQARGRIDDINKKLKSVGITWVCRLVLILLRLFVIRAGRKLIFEFRK